jgi:hypothetical protein
MLLALDCREDLQVHKGYENHYYVNRKKIDGDVGNIGTDRVIKNEVGHGVAESVRSEVHGDHNLGQRIFLQAKLKGG